MFSSMNDLGGRVEVVALVRLGGVGHVLPGQFLDGPEYRVGAACAQCGVQRQVGHQMGADILHARAAAEIDAHQRTEYLAVLKAELPAS